MINEATANYNIEFDNGNFLKDKVYKYKIDPKNSEKVLITTEQGNIQELWYTEFDMLFTKYSLEGENV